MPEIQKDLVLSPNEYAYVLDETKGNVACNVGPHKMSLSQSDNLVKFDTKTKKFIPCDRYNDAISLFVTAPEGWHIRRSYYVYFYNYEVCWNSNQDRNQ